MRRRDLRDGVTRRNKACMPAYPCRQDSSTRIACTLRGPCTPRTRICSMSAVRLVPETNTTERAGLACPGSRETGRCWRTSSSVARSWLRRYSAMWTGGASEASWLPSVALVRTRLPVSARAKSTPVMPAPAAKHSSRNELPAFGSSVPAGHPTTRIPRFPSKLPSCSWSRIGLRDRTTLPILVCSKIEQSVSSNPSKVEAWYGLQPRLCSADSNRSANSPGGIGGMMSTMGGGNLDSAVKLAPFSCVFSTFRIVPSISSRLDTGYAPATRPSCSRLAEIVPHADFATLICTQLLPCDFFRSMLNFFATFALSKPSETPERE